MALQRIKAFATEVDFYNIRRSLYVPSTAYCKETKEVFFQHIRKANWGDIVLWDNYLEERICVYYTEYNINDYPLATYTPEGVVFIPQDILPDGDARMLSLTNMDCTNPEHGKADNNAVDIGDGNYDIWLRWGGFNSENGEWNDIPELINYGEDTNRAQVYVDANGETTGEYSNWGGYLPSDSYHWSYKGSQQVDNIDKSTHWYADNDGSNRFPSPFTTRGEYNPLYGRGVDGQQSSYLSDFNGKQNTAHILSYETYQPNWQTDAQIENINDYNHFPAALCCSRFHTIGTEAGDWYLPAAGELGCLMARFNIIQKALKAINQQVKAVAVQLLDYINYWSSSEYSSSSAYNLYTNYGNMYNFSKGYDSYVRAVCRFRI